jgi:hypothetical protein
MDENVYVILGDEPRWNGSNIYGIHKTLEGAKRHMKRLPLQKPWINYHIEEVKLWE